MDSIETLQARVDELRRQLSSSSPPPAPSTSALPPFRPQSADADPASTSLVPISSSLDAEDEFVRRFRATGRSCFPVELARGARAKEEIKDIERERKRLKGKGKEREEDDREEGDMVRKGTAVRLETFCGGRYYEPYYVVFTRRLPDLHPSSSSPANPPLYIAHHTIPHWLPLSQLAWRYLGVHLQSEDEDPAEQSGEEKAGEADLELFLSHLTAYLNAYVSRREQLVALRTAYSLDSPSSSVASLRNFRLFASESCDRIMVEWTLLPPGRTGKREGSAQEEEEEEDEEDGETRSVVVQIAFHDLKVERFEQIGGKNGASLLVRLVEKGEDLSSQQSILESTARRALSGNKGKAMEEVVRAVVDETTQDGWQPDEEE
ncbi:hypothetical protein JCM8547_004498 [Rhodosporidiobolus lusitaniae]